MLQLIVDMLNGILLRSVQYVDQPLLGDTQTLYSVTDDSVYKQLLQSSDNFIAEQLLRTIKKRTIIRVKAPAQAMGSDTSNKTRKKYFLLGGAPLAVV